MSDVTLETLNRRTAVAAVRQEAARIGVDADVLLDSQRFYNQLGGLDPDAPGFAAQIRDMVTTATGRTATAATAGAPVRQETQTQQPRQWTIEDVRRSSPAECAAALEAGLLVDLGAAPTRRR
jgi:hypothetical protein